MILSGSVILAFWDCIFNFWVPEMVYKYVEVNPLDSTRYFHELAEKFESPVRTAIYCVSFVLLSLHLLHGFNSSMQSVGFNNKYSKALHICLCNCDSSWIHFIALFHHFNH
jgi:succinate dehydrogenase / fumarate reductase cytochrome b subunit